MPKSGQMILEPPKKFSSSKGHKKSSGVSNVPYGKPKKEGHSKSKSRHRARPATLSAPWAGSCEGLNSMGSDTSDRTMVSGRSRSFCTDSLVTPVRDLAPTSGADVYRFSNNERGHRLRSDSMEARWSSDNSVEDYRPTSQRVGIATPFETVYSELSSESSVYGISKPRASLLRRPPPRRDDRGAMSDDEASVDMDKVQRPKRTNSNRRKKAHSLKLEDNNSKSNDKSSSVRTNRTMEHLAFSPTSQRGLASQFSPTGLASMSHPSSPWPGLAPRFASSPSSPTGDWYRQRAGHAHNTSRPDAAAMHRQDGMQRPDSMHRMHV